MASFALPTSVPACRDPDLPRDDRHRGCRKTTSARRSRAPADFRGTHPRAPSGVLMRRTFTRSVSSRCGKWSARIHDKNVFVRLRNCRWETVVHTVHGPVDRVHTWRRLIIVRSDILRCCTGSPRKANGVSVTRPAINWTVAKRSRGLFAVFKVTRSESVYDRTLEITALNI